MNVFVLCTGRCGSQTFARACGRITNFSSAHESQNRWYNPEIELPYRTLRYPPNHIEVDNRLSWFLGKLDEEYGRSAFYVHLLRQPQDVANSLVRRKENSILFAFAWGVLQHYHETRNLSDEQRYAIAVQYCETVTKNIELFLRNKPRKITIWLDEIKVGFTRFWNEIEALGDIDAALAELDIRHNASEITN